MSDTITFVEDDMDNEIMLEDHRAYLPDEFPKNYTLYIDGESTYWYFNARNEKFDFIAEREEFSFDDLLSAQCALYHQYKVTNG